MRPAQSGTPSRYRLPCTARLCSDDKPFLRAGQDRLRAICSLSRPAVLSSGRTVTEVSTATCCCQAVPRVHFDAIVMSA